jgi:hypothetical protein
MFPGLSPSHGTGVPTINATTPPSDEIQQTKRKFRKIDTKGHHLTPLGLVDSRTSVHLKTRASGP